MVELSLNEMVQKIEDATGMKSESCHPDSDGMVSNTTAGQNAKNPIPEQMPDLIEVKEPLELPNMQPVYFQCQKGDYCHFFFNVDKDCVIKINTWPLDENSDPDLYVGIDQDDVDCNKYVFKSNQIGADQIVVYPEDKNFRHGVWRVAIHAFSNGEHQKLGILLTFKEAKPIASLNLLAPLTATVSDSLFFKYQIQDTTDLENLLLLLNISNRKHLQVYIHKNSYPSQTVLEHEYAIGDIP